MSKTYPAVSTGSAVAAFDVVTCEDVRRIVDCRLRWYGLEHIVVEALRREGAAEIAVTLRDVRRNRRHRTVYRTTLAAPSGPASAAGSLAA